jgi:hypothetical protein
MSNLSTSFAAIAAPTATAARQHLDRREQLVVN